MGVYIYLPASAGVEVAVEWSLISPQATRSAIFYWPSGIALPEGRVISGGE